MFSTIAGIIFFATLAMMVQTGIWNNLVTLIAIVIGGLTAFGLHQPLVVMADEALDGSYTYLLDFPILWGVFALTTGLLKQIANFLSKTRVNFPDQVDNYGGAAIGLIAAFVMTSFSMATFHCAPLSYDMFGSHYEYGVTPGEAEKKLAAAFGPTSPDAAWLNFADSVLSSATMGQEVAALGGTKSDGFSAKIFVSQHGKHRKTFGDMDDTLVKRK